MRRLFSFAIAASTLIERLCCPCANKDSVRVAEGNWMGTQCLRCGKRSPGVYFPNARQYGHQDDKSIVRLYQSGDYAKTDVTNTPDLAEVPCAGRSGPVRAHHPAV